MAHSHQIFLFALQIGLVTAVFKFQNLNCIAKEKSIGSFTTCRIKALNRNRNLINIVYYLNKTIAKDLTVHYQFFKRESGGWHPFLYGVSVDVCNFLDGSKRNALTSIIYSYMKSYTNVNHSCPLLVNSEMKLVNMNLNEIALMQKFPLEDGLYAIHTLWYLKKTFFGSINCSANLAKAFKSSLDPLCPVRSIRGMLQHTTMKQALQSIEQLRKQPL